MYNFCLLIPCFLTFHHPIYLPISPLHLLEITLILTGLLPRTTFSVKLLLVFPKLAAPSSVTIELYVVFCFKYTLHPVWGLNSLPQDPESHAPPTEPTRCPRTLHLF